MAKDIRRAMMIAAEPLKVPSTYASMDPDARAAWKSDQMAREGHGSFSPPGTPEREENFNRWYGNSKIRDSEGNPLRLYHATPKSFDTFLPGGPNPPNEMPSGPATWLSPYPDKQPAGHHVGGYEDKFKSGSNVMPVHADIRNPLVIDNKTMRDWARQSYAKGSGEFPLLISPESRKMLLEDGYDGILWAGFGATSKDEAFYDDHGIGEHPDKSEEIIALHPPGRAQIKSAIGNRGQFDPEDTHVNYALGGSATKRALMIARDQRNLLRRIANIYPGPGGGMDPGPGGGGYAGPGGGRYPGPSRYSDGGGIDRNANLAKFLKDSVVPHRVYHGTSDDIRYFSTTHPNRKDAGWLGEGVYLTASPVVASTYATQKRGAAAPNVMPLHIRLTKPYKATTEDKRRLMMIEHTHGREAAQQASADWSNALKSKGHDGVIYEGPIKGMTEYVVFDPANVKSASGNQGTFDTYSDDITRASGGKVDPLKELGYWQDNPAVSRGAHDWLEGKQREAASDPKLLRGATTGGTGVVNIPVDMLKGVPGAMDETPFPGTPKYDRLMKDVKKEGWKPTPILVGVNHKGKPYILEGNHRSAVARAIGQTHVPGEIKWWNGGEEVEGDWHPKKLAPRLKRYERADGGKIPPFKLYSGAAKLIAQKGQAKATPQQYAALPGIKPDELKYAKFEALGNKAVPKEQVLEHLEGNTVPLQETVYTGKDERSALSRYSSPSKSLALPGGANYREVLLHTPVKGPARSPEMEKARERADAATRAYDNALADQLSGMPRLSDDEYRRASAEADEARIALSRLERASKDEANRAGFRGRHWDQPNVLAHVRMSDRRGPNGEKVLHVEEVQSDWGQKARDEGFKGPALTEKEKEELNQLNVMMDTSRTPEVVQRFEQLMQKAKGHRQGVPTGPYVDNTQKWTDLALKRVLHEAAHGGYDKIVVTPGDEQNKRYDLINKVKNISYFPDIGYLHGTTHDNESIEHNDVKPADLAKHIGKEAADRILKQAPQRYEGRGNLGGEFYHELEGDDLKMGGSGMRGYYDNILPKRLQALAQQHDPQAKVQMGSYALKTPQNVEDLPEEEQADYLDRDPSGAMRKVPDARTDLHSLDVTPQMRDSIKQSGFNSFKRGGDVGMRQRYADGGGPPGDHPAWIPTRLITSKKHSPTAGERHIVDVASMKQTPDVFRSNVDLVRAYPNTTAKVAKYKNHDKVANAFIDHVTGNLLALHDAVPEHIRQRSKLWYDGARAITDRWSQKYGLPDHSIAGALAALSPQKDWYQNVSLAERVLDAMRGSENFYKGFTFNDKMAKTFASRPSLNKPAYEGVRQLLNGRSLADLDGLDLSPAAKAQAKALWIRMYDEAHNDPAHRIITPEGGDGDFVTTAKGAKAKVGWGSLTEIGKAIQAIENEGNPEALSQLMGEKHKVRNFYNNILAPQSPHGDVTIDTHAVAAGLLRPLSGNSLEVAHNFASHPGVGLPAARGTAMTGIQGTYPLYADAYRKAAALRGILPREMQSITWEAVRGLFPDTAKTPAHNARVSDVWKQYRNGKIDQHEAQQRIVNLSAPRGIPAPSWFMGGSSGPDAGSQSPAGQGSLPEPLVRRQTSLAPVSRARGGTAPYVSPQSGRPPAHKVAIGRAGYALSGKVEQLGRDLHQSFSGLNRQVAAAPQHQQAAPAGGDYQAMTRQATQPSLSPDYQAMVENALKPSGKTYNDLFPTASKPAPAAPTPAAAAQPEPSADAVSYYSNPYNVAEMMGGDGSYKRGGKVNIVERALAVTRRK